MLTSKLRKWAIFKIYSARGQDIGRLYNQYQKEEREGIPPDTTGKRLIRLLQHCQTNVPYYRRIMEDLGNFYHDDPFEYIKRMPVLSKEILRTHFDELKSDDLPRRQWYVNTTGGSTGEPVKFIQDREFDTLSSPITDLIPWLIGVDKGESIIIFWGSLHDLKGIKENWVAKVFCRLSNIRILSVYHLDPETIESYIALLNRKPPKLIVGYVDSLNEIAKYARQAGLPIRRQNAIITSAGTLYPEFRETIEQVFQCKIYNRYGSRELGSIACERPGYTGLWVPPWNNYLEVVDPDGKLVPNGREGEILVTSLCNYAMPLLRYEIGDRGVLASPDGNRHPRVGQVLERLTGRTIEIFYNVRGEVVDASHFMPILYNLEWIRKYQVIQNGPSCITFRIVKIDGQPPENDLAQIIRLSRGVMHDDTCQIKFQFVDEIPLTRSGKFKFIAREMESS